MQATFLESKTKQKWYESNMLEKYSLDRKLQLTEEIAEVH